MQIILRHPSLRVIIDCTEIKISEARGPTDQQVIFSKLADLLGFINPSEITGGNIHPGLFLVLRNKYKICIE